jgi:hypothetical protein
MNEVIESIRNGLDSWGALAEVVLNAISRRKDPVDRVTIRATRISGWYLVVGSSLH